MAKKDCGGAKGRPGEWDKGAWESKKHTDGAMFHEGKWKGEEKGEKSRE